MSFIHRNEFTTDIVIFSWHCKGELCLMIEKLALATDGLRKVFFIIIAFFAQNYLNLTLHTQMKY